MVYASFRHRIPGFPACIGSTGIFGADTHEGREFSLPGHQILQILVTALLGTFLSAVGWLIVFHWHGRAIELEYASRANNVASTLQARTDEYFDKITALRALFNSSAQGISRQEFDTFAEVLLKRHPAMLSVSWIPRVKRSERFAHEQAAVRDGVSGYRIKSVAPDGSFATAPERDEYYPVYYTSEKLRAGPIYGLDLADGGLREEALKHARDGDRLAASRIFVLQSGTGDRRGFFVLLPVYGYGLPHETVAERRRNLVGFVQGVFQLSAMVETILGTIRTPLDMHIFGADSGPSALPIHTHSSSFRKGPAEPMPLDALTAGLHWQSTLELADVKWKLVTVPIAGAPNSSHLSAWLLLIVGLVVTGAVVTFMWSSARYALNLYRANQKVLELAQTDSLTKLDNRRALLDRLDVSFAANRRRGRPFALLYIDLDHFKDINDTLGHPVGDALLWEAGRRLKELVRASDIVARVGGDEFAVLQMDAVDPAASDNLAARIVDRLGEPYVIDGNEAHITASVGISNSSAELDAPEAVMVQADLALYRAKEDGRNCFRFHTKELDQRLRERVIIAEELRTAVARGELELHYQPQVEITSGEIVGLEALLRWNHPHHGFIAPSLFIPIAEKSGSIVALGKWAFEEACRQTRMWEDEGIGPPSVAVNVSAIQFKRSELDRDIAESMERWSINPGKMEIELTESVLMVATQGHGDILDRLHKLGLSIAIDDFGTGYSSLNYLTSYPLDRLKIAQELVFRVTSDPRHATVVRTAIRLAQELGIECIAEGVETSGQALFLVSAGCRYAQGYYFGRPVDARRATELLRLRRIRPDTPEQADDLTAA